MSFQKIIPFVICICLASFYANAINAIDRTNQKNEEKLSREFIQAVHRKNRSLWEPILEKQMSQNTKSEAIEMAIQAAMYLEYIEFFEYFLKKGGDIRQSLNPSVGNLELHIIKHKKEKVFEYLLNRNLLVLTPNSPIEKIELNTDMEPNLYARKMMDARYKSDLLYQTVIHGTDRMVQLLLEKGFDPNQMADRQTIFRDITDLFKDDRRTLDLLIQYGLQLDDDDMILVTRGIEEANIPFLEYLITHKIPIDPKPLKRRVSPLFRALNHRARSNELVSFLIHNGYDPKEVYLNGSTPLHLAVNHCNLQTIKLLLDKGLNPHTVNKGGYSPIDYAKGNPEKLSILKNGNLNL